MDNPVFDVEGRWCNDHVNCTFQIVVEVCL